MQVTSTLRGDVRTPLALALIASSFLGLPSLALPQRDDATATRTTSLDTPQPSPSADWALAPAAVRAVAGSPIDQLLFDEPGDGALWARGTNYKARFDGESATIVPFFGSDAPRNYPLELRARAALGGVELATTTARATRAGNAVRIDHGAFVEEYELTTKSLEQRFVFDELRGSGDLVLRLAVASELAGSDRGATLRFENQLGRIEYGAAFAIDARGERIALDSTLIDGAIQLVVPAEFVASAALPLTIDPLISSFGVAEYSLDDRFPDVSYDVTTDRWAVVWNSIWSSSDYDVFVKLVDGSGLVQPTLLTIDFTSETWGLPKIANNNRADVFLVVASVVPPPSFVGQIRGRLAYPGAQVTGAPFPISPLDGAYRNGTDVGGDPFPAGGSFFCVVWQRGVSPTNVDIDMQMVAPDGQLSGGPVALESSAQRHELPSISSSLGKSVGGSQSCWTVVWQRAITSQDHDIYGAQVGWSGTLTHPMFPISLVGNDETMPTVSMLLDPLSSSVERPYMVVYQRNWPSDSDVIATVMQGSTVLATQTITSSSFDGANLFAHQYAPTVDSDGAQFLIGYDESPDLTPQAGDLWVTNAFLSGSSIVANGTRKSLAATNADDDDLSLCSAAGSGGAHQRYFGTWSSFAANGTYDVQGALWNGAEGGVVSVSCKGDDSGAACPCGNNGASGHGCANSANPSGALLDWSGEASVSADSFALHASGMPATATCLFFQGASMNGFGVPFGDGKRCVLGPVTRLGLKICSAGAASYPELGDSGVSVRGSVPELGATIYYQAWYRDPAPFCGDDTFNMTNGLAVTWAP